MTVLAPQQPTEPAVSPAVPAVVEVTEMDIVQEWGLGSFPASDPPANW